MADWYRALQDDIEEEALNELEDIFKFAGFDAQELAAQMKTSYDNSPSSFRAEYTFAGVINILINVGMSRSLNMTKVIEKTGKAGAKKLKDITKQMKIKATARGSSGTDATIGRVIATFSSAAFKHADLGHLKYIVSRHEGLPAILLFPSAASCAPASIGETKLLLEAITHLNTEISQAVRKEYKDADYNDVRSETVNYINAAFNSQSVSEAKRLSLYKEAGAIEKVLVNNGDAWRLTKTFRSQIEKVMANLDSKQE